MKTVSERVRAHFPRSPQKENSYGNPIGSKFPMADGAQQVEGTLLELHRQHLIEVQDAAMVIWPQGARRTPGLNSCRA